MSSFLLCRHFAFILILAISLLACSQAENTPEEVAMQWKIYMDHGDYAAAKLLSTPNAVEFIEFIERLDADMEDLDLEDMDYPPMVTSDQVTCEVSGSKALCIICCDEMGNHEEIDLILKNGKWLVDLEFDPALEQDLRDFERMMEELQELMEQSKEHGEFPLPEEDLLPEM